MVEVGCLRVVCATLSWCRAWISRNSSSSVYGGVFSLLLLYSVHFSLVFSCNFSSIAAARYVSKEWLPDALSTLVQCRSDATWQACASDSRHSQHHTRVSFACVRKYKRVVHCLNASRNSRVCWRGPTRLCSQVLANKLASTRKRTRKRTREYSQTNSWVLAYEVTSTHKQTREYLQKKWTIPRAIRNRTCTKGFHCHPRSSDRHGLYLVIPYR